MRKFLIVAGIVFSVAACSKSKWDDATSGAEKFKDKMCACKDKACTESVHKEQKEWEKSMESKFKEDDLKNAPKDFMEKMEKIDNDTRECRHKFDGAGGDTAAPATPPAP